eukprot:CAMPEP_0117685326 /NCGR_PEP_ID=MMETSP0804-20121206/21669_1 /TAXON_ID=1074897 /ORGANISM="Tetraselmis astigmatica, Strain CCMP880" /LENGTH=468 /DNA_ID=CAMNT_0005496569 /DNA_START=135 /DNA_END=1542 /DNA_ORIENTATION=+
MDPRRPLQAEKQQIMAAQHLSCSMMKAGGGALRAAPPPGAKRGEVPAAAAPGAVRYARYSGGNPVEPQLPEEAVAHPGGRVSEGHCVCAVPLGGVLRVLQSHRPAAVFVNVKPDEVIRSLFYNKSNNSIITVSVYSTDNYSSLQCRSTPLESIRLARPDEGFALFESECLRWPGFVEFDDVNGKVLTFSAEERVYKVFDLRTYKLLYDIVDHRVQEVKVSPGILLMILLQTGNQQPLRILSIEDGTPAKELVYILQPGKTVEFVEQFNEKLLVKQESENLQIVNLRTDCHIEVGRTESMTPAAFIFLYEKEMFLTFQPCSVSVWNFQGELITVFEDNQMWCPDSRTNNIFITHQQDTIISFSLEDRCGEQSTADRLGSRGFISVSDILTGKCLARIEAPGTPGCLPLTGLAERTAAALTDVTALFYDEDRNEIYTGTRDGLVHMWGAGPSARQLPQPPASRPPLVPRE